MRNSCRRPGPGPGRGVGWVSAPCGLRDVMGQDRGREEPVMFVGRESTEERPELGGRRGEARN